MGNLWQKLLTKPLWHWERMLASLITSAPNLPPIIINRELPPLVILTTKKTFKNALWTAYSLLTYLEGKFSLMLVIDGEQWPEELTKEYERLFPGVTTKTTYQCVKNLPSDSKALRKLANEHPMGRKLATIFTLNQEGAIVFSDDDVLAFRSLEEIINWAQNGCQAPALYLQEEQTNHDPAVKAAGERLGLKAAQNINVGLLALPKCELSLPKLEMLLMEAQKGPSDKKLSWFPDTSALAYQLAGGAGLPTQTYIVNCQRQFFFESDVNYTQIRLRHFVGPVRHLLRLRGIPAFLHSCNSRRS